MKGTRAYRTTPVMLTMLLTLTLIVTLEAELDAPRLSWTTSENVRELGVVTAGAVNVGRAAVELLRVTAVPEVCTQV